MHSSFTNTNLQPFQLPFPHYTITLDDGTIFNQLLQQEQLLSDDHSSNHNNIAAHQKLDSHDINSNLQSAMGKYNNTYINGDDDFNKPRSCSKRRRASKRDRHSKISTAYGLRDRRMRLSLKVSKKFFGLQDMLGFDKPSKTVEWLLMKSNSNIQELINHEQYSFSGESSTSKYDILSELYNVDGDQNAKSSSSMINQKEKKKTIRVVRKSCYLLRAKETREMARKRARERTLKKGSKLACDDQLSRFGPCLMERDTNCLIHTIINQPEQPTSHFHLNQGIIDGNSSSMILGFNPSLTRVHPDQEHRFNDFRY